MATEYTAGNGLDDEARREFETESALMNKALGMSPGDTEDNCRWAAFYLSGKLGIDSVDGAIYNNRKPMPPRDYLKKMQEVWKARDISTLYDDEAKGYRAIDGEAPDALEQRYAYAMQHANDSVGNRLGTVASRAVARDRITADELEWLTAEERKEAGKWDPEMRIGEDAAQVIGDLENEYGAGFFHEGVGLSDDILARRASLRGRSVEAERAEYEKAIRTAREAFPLYEDKAAARARRDAARPHVKRLKDIAEKRRAVAAYEKKLSEQNAWHIVLDGKQLLSEEGQAIVDMAEAHKDDLVGAVGEKFRELQRKDPKEAATLAAIIHALQPSAGDAMRAFGRTVFETPVGALKTVVNVVERQIVGGEKYQRRREAEAEWRRAFEPMQKEHDFWGNVVVGFAGTIPYMVYAALPGGTAAVALSAANDFERQIVDQGGDVSSQEFQFARIAVGFGYAAIEKAQVIHPFRSIENRAWAHLYSTMTESVMSFLKTAGHQGMRYLSELGEEGLQGAVEQGFVAWGLGKDVASAAAKGLVEEAWGAIGPFAPLMALEAGSAKATYRRGGFNAADMARQKLILDGLKDRAATAMDAANYGKAYGAIARTWASMGENAALRQNELRRRYGVTADEALSMDQALGKMWAAVNGDAEAESAFMGGAKVKSAAELLSEVFTDAKVESRENGIVVFSGKIGDTGNEVRFLIGKSDTVLDTEDRSQWESIVSAVNGSVDGDKSGKAAEALAGMADGAKRMTVSEWEQLTPEARQLIAEVFGLSVRGGIKSRVQRIKVDTSAADGSTEKSDIDTMAFYLVSGKIDLTRDALPQAVFHETMHSMIGFAEQMARAGDENAQAVLSALAEAYPALSGREGLDEEAIANGYRDYLTGKIPLVEVQKSAFDKFFEFVGKWLGMIDDTGERALTVANAQSAMNVFFNDVLTGNFSAIEDAGRLADVAMARNARIQKERIERTEREAAAPTEATGESARTADEKFGGAIVAAEDELVDENGETIPPDKVAEAVAQGKAIMKRSEFERRKAEGVGVSARETDDEQRERVKREQTLFEGTDESGRATVSTPDGAMEIETQLAVVDRDGLLTSDREGYPQEYQDKISRDKGAGGAQIEKIGRAPNSGMLGASETSDLGAPIVWRDADGRLVVIAGNGRVLGLRAGDGKYKSTGNYDDFAMRTAERYGIQVPEGMAHPTLVRVIETDLTRDQLVKFALASNRSTLQEKNDADNMRSDGLRIDADMAAKIAADTDAGLMDPRNAEFVNAFLASANGGALTGADGQLNATGVRRLRDALLGALLVRHPAANETITILQDPRNDLGIGNVVEGVKDAAIHLVALKGREEWAEYDLSDDIADALNDYIDFKRGGHSDIADYLGQGDFLRNRPSLTAAIMRELFARRNSAQRVADILDAYAKTAMLQDNTGPALFDMGVTPRETVWRLAVEKADARDTARHSVEAARGSIEANPNLLGDVEAVLLKRTAENPQVKQAKRSADVVFSYGIPFFDFLGVPNGKVVSDATRVRKMQKYHFLDAGKIAALPEHYNEPAAVLRGNDGEYIVVTDMTAQERHGKSNSVVVCLRPTSWRNGEVVLLASAFAPDKDKESGYFKPLLGSNVMFVDENKVAGLALEEETRSILRTRASGDDVLTAEDYSLWSTRNSIAQSGENVKGGRNSVEAEAQRQYDEVVARYTNPDGTRKPGWMMAPNGKPTRLTERQWVQVRTPYFKEWFGDWEALAELPGASIEDAKGVFRALMTSNANIATADGTTLHFAAQASKAYSREAEKESSNRAAHWCAVRNIESLIGRSRFLYEEKPRNGSSDIDAYVKYGSMFTFGGERYLAKITSKRYTGRDAQNFYSVESVSVEKIADRGIHEAIGKQQSLDTDSVNRIRQILDSVKPENVSKVVAQFAKIKCTRNCGGAIFEEAHLPRTRHWGRLKG